MKVRFLRDGSLTGYIASQINVETVSELFDAIRKEKNVPADLDLNENVKITPTSFDDPALMPTYQIYVIDVGLIGYCNGPLKDIQEKTKTPVPQGPYYIDTKVEHGCCWNRCIRRPKTEQEKKSGLMSLRDSVMVLECHADEAKFIRDALNVAHAAKEKKK